MRTRVLSKMLHQAPIRDRYCDRDRDRDRDRNREQPEATGSTGTGTDTDRQFHRPRCSMFISISS